MWVDIDDVRAEIEHSYRKYEEELRGEEFLEIDFELDKLVQEFTSRR